MNMKQKGFSLLELIVATFLLTMFLTILYVSVSNLTDDISRKKNEVYPETLANAIKDFYLKESYDIDKNSTGSAIAYNEDGLLVLINNRDITIEREDELVAMYSTLPYANFSIRDGYNQPMMILVSNLLEHDYEGTMIPYRVFAVVSSFNQDIIDGSADFLTQMDVNSGEVIPHEEESVVVVNTLPSQIELFNETKEKVKQISDAYAQYYWGRQNYRVRDNSVNYFATDASGDANWDQNNGLKVNKSCDSSPSTYTVSGFNTPGVYSSDINFATRLGLSSSYELTSWSSPIYIMNCGVIPNVYIGGGTHTLRARSPETGDGQPYSAYVGFTMSNGQSYVENIFATF